jgi:hypothetical protein
MEEVALTPAADPPAIHRYATRPVGGSLADWKAKKRLPHHPPRCQRAEASAVATFSRIMPSARVADAG